jgi:hypothetical protein
MYSVACTSGTILPGDRKSFNTTLISGIQAQLRVNIFGRRPYAVIMVGQMTVFGQSQLTLPRRAPPASRDCFEFSLPTRVFLE